MVKKIAIIIGAGPAGLTAAYELLKKTGIKPIIFEETEHIGGISKTINYKGNRIDIGGHRFFSKSTEIMKWWDNIFPIQTAPAKDELILKIKKDYKEGNVDPEKKDDVFLIRDRISRIFFLRKFFNYPISITKDTLLNLGLKRVIKILFSYIKIKLFPIKKEKNLEDFFINRFGKELYCTFFEDYTEKVWGVPCREIKSEWGAQRIKELSISKAVTHAIKNILKRQVSIEQKNVETSLIEKFLYPKYGPGQLWEKVANIIIKNGGELYLNHKVIGLKKNIDKIIEIEVKNLKCNKNISMEADYFFSSMPVKDLINSFGPDVPKKVKFVASGLIYRDFITVGLLLNKLRIKNLTKVKTVNNIIPDNWIYIQDRDVKLGRIQIFNNWSPYMVKNLDTVWLGLEYFCNENSALWNMPDKEFIDLAINELIKIGFIDKEDVMDSVRIKIPKAYPAYFNTYSNFHIIKNYINTFKNLFLIGRNGMHRYNNQDHSMLSAIVAVDNINKSIIEKDNIWNINIEKEYHETIKSTNE